MNYICEFTILIEQCCILGIPGCSVCNLEVTSRGQQHTICLSTRNVTRQSAFLIVPPAHNEKMFYQVAKD